MTDTPEGPSPRGIPTKHEETFTELHNEVCRLHATWKVYRQLFAEKENVEVVNEAAPAAGRIIQDALLHHVLLSLARLTDPAKQGKNRQNLSVEHIKIIADEIGGELADKVDIAVKEVAVACQLIRKHRDKKIAHLDLPVALAQETLPGYSRQQIEVALAALRDLMNTICRHFHDSTTMYEAIIVPGAGDAMIATLRDGLRLQQFKHKAYLMTAEQLRSDLFRGR